MTHKPPDGQRFDLHLHTELSDGRYPVDETLERCAAAGLEVVALTDHDLATTADPGPQMVGGRRLHVIHGAEVSGVHEGREYHLLVYFPGEAPTGFRAFCEEQMKLRAARYDAAVEAIGLPGIAPPPEGAHEGQRAVTRHHLARAVVEAGHAPTLQQAFRDHAHDGNVPRMDTPFLECIRVARAHGGVASWAHPPVRAVEKFLPDFVAAGLQGLEGLRPGLTRSDRLAYKRAAKKHGLLLTGGSDWHGWPGLDLGLFHVRPHEVCAFTDALAAAA